MSTAYLLKMDEIEERAGTKDPEELMDYLGFVFIDPGLSIDGFITRVKGFGYYGVNSALSDKKREFAAYHECFHGVCGHLDLPGFISESGLHADRGTFADYKLVADTEREANTGAADQIIDTKTVLDMLGYGNRDVEGYRKSMQVFEQAVAEYRDYCSTVQYTGSSAEGLMRIQDYSEELCRMYARLGEQAEDIAGAGLCLSRSEIAAELDVPAYIVDYKLRALRLRHYSIPATELLPFDKVFRAWGQQQTGG